MEDFLKSCNCGQYEVFQKYINGVPNVKHWVIRYKNCNASVETRTKERAIELWNDWDLSHTNKIHNKMDGDKDEQKLINTVQYAGIGS